MLSLVIGCEHLWIQLISRNLNWICHGLYWNNSFPLLISKPTSLDAYPDCWCKSGPLWGWELSDIIPSLGYIRGRDFGLAMDPAHVRSFLNDCFLSNNPLAWIAAQGYYISYAYFSLLNCSRCVKERKMRKKNAKIGAEEQKQRRDKRKCFGRQKSWKIKNGWKGNKKNPHAFLWLLHFYVEFLF